MDISVREATVDDYEALCELYDEIDRLHREALPHIFQKPGGAVRELDYYMEQLADAQVGILVAETGAILVGVVHAAIRETTDIPVRVPRRYAVVDTLVVKSAYRNQDIGRILMDSMEAWASANGAASIDLNVYDFNLGAIAFYERIGYQALSRKMCKEINTDEPTEDMS